MIDCFAQKNLLSLSLEKGKRFFRIGNRLFFRKKSVDGRRMNRPSTLHKVILGLLLFR